MPSSSGSKNYETLLYTDGSASCDCPGWTRRKVRSCKHTRGVDMGIADAMAVAVKDYRPQHAFDTLPLGVVTTATTGIRRIKYEDD